MKTPDENAHASEEPAIGPLLCKSKNKVVAEYALHGSTCPLASRSGRLNPSRRCRKEIASSLPSVADVDAGLTRLSEDRLGK